MDPTRAVADPVARALAADVSRRDVAVRLGAGGLAALLLAAGQRPMGAAAQDASPAAALPTAGHLLVGAWWIDTADSGPTSGADWAIFDPNGTWVPTSPGASPSVPGDRPGSAPPRASRSTRSSPRRSTPCST